MDRTAAERIETNAERGAAAALAGAVGYATYGAIALSVPPPLLAAAILLASGAAFLLCRRVQANANRQPAFVVPLFDIRQMEAGELLLGESDRLHDELLLTEDQRLGEELLLTDADRLQATATKNNEPLVLDDVLAAIGPGSRVVRLFDREAMPSPGELRTRIEGHIGASEVAASSDASRQLSNALAELRQSLR